MSPDVDEIDRTSLENQINGLKEQIDKFRTMGVNVDAAETILNQAIKAFAEDNLVLANTLYESANETAKLIRQQYFIQASSILFSSLQRTIMELEGAGSEVNYIKDLYNKAKQMFDMGKYEEAMSYIKSAEDLANDLKIDTGADLGADVVDEEVGEGVFEVDQSQEQMERVSKILIRVDELLQKAIDEGYAINEAEKLYSLAEDAFDYQDYKKAESYATEAEQSLNQILEPLFAEKSRYEKVADSGDDIELEETSQKKPKFSDIMPMGIIGDAPVTNGKEKIPDSKDVEIGEIVDSSVTEYDEIDTETTTGKVSKEIIEDLMQKSKKPPKLSDESDEFELELSLDSELNPEPEIKPEPEPIQELIEDTKALELELEPEPEPIDIEAKATNLMEKYEKMINVAKRIGLNLPMAERLFSIAESYFENGEFESVIEYTDKGFKNINEMATRKGLSEQMNAEMKGQGLEVEALVEEREVEQKESIAESISTTPITKAKTKSIDKPDRVKRKKGELERAKRSAKKKVSEKKKGKKSKTAKKLKAALGKIRDEIKEAKSMGFNVDEAETLIKKAFTDLKDNNFASAKETGIESKNTIKNIKKSFIKQKALDLVKEAWKEISDAEANGKDVTRANGLLEEARNLIKEGKFELAAEKAINAVNIFK